MPVLRRPGLRPRARGPRVRGPAALPRMNDLRARIAAIVERDRARRSPETCAGGARRGARPAEPNGEGGVSLKFPPPTAFQAIEVRERRIAVDDLGLEVVG